MTAALPGMTPASGLDQGRVIGLPVNVGTMATAAEEIMRLAHRGAGGHVCVANVHMVVEARRDAALREVMESAALVVSDGMPLVRRLRRRGFRGAEQVRGPDLMKEICRRAAEEKLPVYFYGGHEEGLMAKLQASLAGSLPKLRIARAQAAPRLPLKPAVDPAIVEDIRDSGARIVFVSLGCPKQEFWMRSYAPTSTPCCLGSGKPSLLLQDSCRKRPFGCAGGAWNGYSACGASRDASGGAIS